MKNIPYTNLPAPEPGPTGAAWELDCIPAALAIARYGCKRSTLGAWARSGKVRAYKLGRNWFYNSDDLEDALHNAYNPTTPD